MQEKSEIILQKNKKGNRNRLPYDEKTQRATVNGFQIYDNYQSLFLWLG